MNAIEPTAEKRDTKEIWSVVVVYESTATRERAMSVCDHLVKQFWSEVEFSFRWWRTDFLEDAALATSAAIDAATANFIIFCAGVECDLTPAAAEWFDSWVERRNGREGALIDLTEVVGAPDGRGQRLQAYLRGVARRAMMDYLTRVSSGIMGGLPDS